MKKAFGLDKIRFSVYDNKISLLLFVSILLLLSLDSINRYFELLKLNELEESTNNSILRFILFLFILLTLFFGRNLPNIAEIKPLFLFFLCTFFSIVYNVVDIAEFAKSILYSFSFILSFTYGIQVATQALSVKKVVYLFNLLITVILVRYLQMYFFEFESIVLTSNDAIFNLIVYAPFVFFVNKRIVLILLVLFISVLTVFSLKRSAIFFVNFSFIVALFIYAHSKKSFIPIIICFLLSLFFIFFEGLSFVVEYQVSELLMNRFETKGDNGRSEILSSVLIDYFNGNIGDIFFGHGFLATTKKFGIPSHNDYIEILYDFGILPLIMYLVFSTMILLRIVMWYKKKENYLRAYMSLVTSFILILGLSMLNSMFFSIHLVILYFGLGFSFGLIYKNK